MATKMFTVGNGLSGQKTEVSYGSATGGQTITSAMTDVTEIKVFVNDGASKLAIYNALEAVQAKLSEVELA
jgi:hypothetical protein